MNAACAKYGTLEPCQLFDLLQLRAFDPLMVLSFRDNESAIRNNLMNVEGDAQIILGRLASWSKFKRSDVPAIFDQSYFIGDGLRQAIGSWIKPIQFKRAVEYLCTTRGLYLPPAIAEDSFAMKFDILTCASRKKEVTCGEVARWAQVAIDQIPALKNYALMMVKSLYDLGPLVAQALDGRPIDIDATPACFGETKDKNHQQQFEVRTVGHDLSAAAAILAMESTEGAITVAGRVTNSPLFPPQLALLMWRLPGTNTNFLLNMHDRGPITMEIVRQVVLALYRQSLKSVNSTHLRLWAKNTIGSMPGSSASDDRPPASRRNAVDGMARKQRRPVCPATRSAILWSTEDVTDAVIFHLAWEVDIVAKS